MRLALCFINSKNQTKQKVATEINTDSLEIVTNVFQELGFMSWESFVNNRLPLLKLPPDILEVLRQGKIAYTKAKALVSVKDLATRRRLLVQAIEENLSLGAIKKKKNRATETRSRSHYSEFQNQEY